jgi:hypothetical protein
MGGSRYSDTIYESRTTRAKEEGRDVFEHTDRISKGIETARTHESLDPRAPNKAGKLIRESFDSEAHPESRAIAVGFDVTGSMATVPRVFRNKLGNLMKALVAKGYLPHPHIMFAAIGDSRSDKASLQVGQFEAGNEMDDALTNIFLEGNGGPYGMESYQNFWYYMARHTDLDCLKKRDQKGILFTSGDELPYPEVSREEVQRLIGDSLQENIKTEQILEELREKFDVFWILPGGTSGWGNEHNIDTLRAQYKFGQNLILLQEPGDICELICSTVGVLEGYDLSEVGATLKELGSDKDAVDRASKAIVPFAKTRAVSKNATASGVLVETGKDAVERL